MSPTNMELPDHIRSVPRETSQRSGHTRYSLQQTSAPAGRSRSDDSWIEVSSQPSSSSLSSANDEIITTGLRVQHDSNDHRRRRRPSRRPHLDLGYHGSSAGTSSQEEYEESESESDRVMSSSNEGLPPYQESRSSNRMVQYSSASSDNQSDIVDDDNDEDENSTAVGYIRTTEPCFTPQPNAFSHPPSTRQQQQQQQQSSYFPPTRPSVSRTQSQRHSYPSRHSHSPYSMVSPTHQADHDAALRASLSTLLSCAAAARGLPKPRASGTSSATAPPPSSSRVDPSTLRMVPESVALGSGSPSRTATTATTTSSSSPSPPPSAARAASSRSPTDKPKRQRTSSKDRRGSSSKKRRASTAMGGLGASGGGGTGTGAAIAGDEAQAAAVISPTLLTWVVSAGVVVLVSALSFSAGYVVGRDAGRAEVEMLADMQPTSTCAGEALRGSAGGLRRLRLSGAVGAVGVR